MQTNQPAAQLKKTILVVDDNADIRNSLARLLRVFGFRTAVAANGRAALDHLRDDPSTGLIVLDLMMPVMDGWEFRSEQVQDARFADIPVVVCSGAGSVEGQPSFEGTVAFRKPVDPDQLVALARRCCST